jgi:arylsulfatase A-like enzyme
MLRGYGERVALIDQAIGQIRDLLLELGQWDETLLVVTSDHGEAFFENAGLARHGYVPFETVLRVPLVISYPRALRAGGTRAVEVPTWHLDLLPTILAFAGIEAPPDLHGRSLRDVMLGSASLPPKRQLFPAVMRLALDRPPVPMRRVALELPLKWIEGHPLFGQADPMLFDLSQDPGEQHDLGASSDSECARLAAAAAAWEEHLVRRAPVHQVTGQRLEDAPERAGPAVKLSPEEEEKLRALGYLD